MAHIPKSQISEQNETKTHTLFPFFFRFQIYRNERIAQEGTALEVAVADLTEDEGVEEEEGATGGATEDELLYLSQYESEDEVIYDFY